MGKTVQESKANPMGDRTSELHALTRAEEESCNKAMKKAAIEYCQDSMKEFVQCSKDHNVTVMWSCRDKLKTMNECLKGRTSREELDKLKLEKLMAKRAELAN